MNLRAINDFVVAVTMLEVCGQSARILPYTRRTQNRVRRVYGGKLLLLVYDRVYLSVRSLVTANSSHCTLFACCSNLFAITPLIMYSAR